MVAKERQLKENRMFCYHVDYSDPWNVKYKTSSLQSRLTMTRESVSLFNPLQVKLWWIQQRRNKSTQRCRRRYWGTNGELVWTAVHLAPGSQSVHYPCPRLKWTQCANYYRTFMNTVINLWGSKDLLIYRSTTILSRRNLFHEVGYTQRHSPLCGVVSQFIDCHWLTDSLTF
jgi:hypothetical protein